MFDDYSHTVTLLRLSTKLGRKSDGSPKACEERKA